MGYLDQTRITGGVLRTQGWMVMGILLLESSLVFERVETELPEHVCIRGRKNGEVVCIGSCKTTNANSTGSGQLHTPKHWAFWEEFHGLNGDGQ